MSMRNPGAPEESAPGRSGREAGTTTSRPTPLALVSDAVAGGELRDAAETAARALGCPVAIAIPALGPPAIVPEGSVDVRTAAAIGAHAERTVAAGAPPDDSPAQISEAVPIRIAEQVVGVVAAVAVKGPARAGAGDRHAWLQATATAASVTALIQESHGRPAQLTPGAEIIAELSAAEPQDLAALLTRARRAGVELRGGAVALAAHRNGARGERDGDAPAAVEQLALGLPSEPVALVGLPAPGRLQALVPLSRGASATGAQALAEALRADGWTVALSAPRRDPALLRQALREAELLGELYVQSAPPPGQEETYRLLIGVLLRDPDELEALREQTISPVAKYDARHDTELLVTLRAFLVHDGSTTGTAEAMRLHRHTVGYRLSRVHEVSGLSPYESTGRERLSLGLKAEQIIAVARQIT
jgi:PucR-like helix-turn-helix protein